MRPRLVCPKHKPTLKNVTSRIDGVTTNTTK